MGGNAVHDSDPTTHSFGGREIRSVPKKSAPGNARPARLGARCASRSSGTPVASWRPRTARCCAIRGSRRRTSARGSRSPATTASIRPSVVGTRLPLRLAPAPRPLRSRVARPPRAQAGPRAAARVRHRPARTGAGARSASTTFVRTKHGERIDLDGLGVTILAMTSPADGPLGDSAIILDDGTARVLNQNDARPGNLDELHDARPVRRAAAAVLGRDLVSDRLRLPGRGEGTSRARRNAIDEMERAQHYVEAVDADPRLPVRGSALLPRPRPLRVQRPRPRSRPTSSPTKPCSSTSSRRTGSTTRTSSFPVRSSSSTGGACTVTHPADDAATRRPFADKRAYLERVPRRLERLARGRAAPRGPAPGTISSPSSRRWFEPLLEQAPITSAGVAGNVVLDVGDRRRRTCASTSSSRKCGPWRGEPYVYKIDVDRRLIETLVDDHVEDWVNSLFLSCRFTAHRDGAVQRVRA